MGLSPRMFWSLTPREFWIKHRAFIRSESRRDALCIEYLVLPHVSNNAKRNQLQRAVNQRKQYPVKAWLKSQ